MPKRYTIEDMNEYVSNRGGKCLSKEYINVESPLKWRCEKGHTWEADFQIIRQGGWCMQCLKKQDESKDKLEKIKEISRKKGGKCLSSEYLTKLTKLEFQCAEGHIWRAIAKNVEKGSWCKQCANNSYKDLIETFQKIATERGGKCVSTEYINCNSKLEFQCAKGHMWTSTPAIIKKGGWCRKCSPNPLKDSIETYHRIAAERGGKCLSTEYTNKDSKLEFQCSEGHIWKASAGNVKSLGNWCLKCSNKLKAEKSKDSIVLYQKIAAEHGGKCLSKIYINSQSDLEFQCSKGHTWKAKANSVKLFGYWCKKCAAKQRKENQKEKKRPNSKDMYDTLALTRGGKCISLGYEKGTLQIKFQCDKGHVWKMNPYNIRKGRWCPQCGYNKEQRRLLSIEDCHKLAIDRGGKCLSAKFITTRSKMEFQCAQGHIWNATPDNVKRGKWCPKCAVKIKADKQRGSVETYRKIAIKHGGKCLSKETEYTNKNSKLEFQCAEGHVWKASADSAREGRWCPICAINLRIEKRKKTIEIYQTIARNKGGKCLSPEYIGRNSKLEFQCEKGHIWKTVGANIKHGSWCHVCGHERTAQARRKQIKESYSI